MVQGKAWKYKDNINTDIITPPAALELSIEEAAKYTMSPIDPDFASRCRQGDIFVAEHNLGPGSSRETSPLMLKQVGIEAVVAMDFARIFYRNCVNVGLLVIECPQTDRIRMGDVLALFPEEGYIENVTRGERYACSRIPDHITAITRAGGLIPYLKNRIKDRKQ